MAVHEPAPVVAIDVGGTSIKAGVLHPDGTVTDHTRRDTPVSAGVPAVVERILEVGTDLLRLRPDAVAVGIGVPGVVEAEAGIARLAVNLGWRDLPLAQLARARFGVPVALGHDVRNAALAEATFGAGRHERSVWFVSLGTGIAGGMITDGRVDDGATGQAGEFGHLPVVVDGVRCGCGNIGCLETVASASRIELRYAERSGLPATAREIAHLVEGGDVVARQIWDEAAAALGTGLAAVTVLSDPGLIVLGGGLSLAKETLLQPVRIALAERLTFRQSPAVTTTALGDLAGLQGAGLRARLLIDAA